MLLMADKGIRDGNKCNKQYVINRYAKANNKYMKSYDKSIKSSYLMYLDAKNFLSQKQFLKNFLNGFEWVEDLSQFKEDFIKNYDEDSNKGYFLEVDVEYPKNLHNCIVIHRFYQKINKLKM